MNDLRYDNLSLNLDDEFIILAEVSTRNDVNKYEFTINDTTYDIAQAIDTVDKYNVGLHTYPKSNINGIIFDDTNYDGIYETEANIVEDVTLTAHQYYYDGSQWVDYTDIKFTIKNGNIVLNTLPTYVMIDNVKYIAGYKFTLSDIPTTLGLSYYEASTNLKHNMAKFVTEGEFEIISPQATENDLVIVASTNLDDVNNIYLDKYDIASINEELTLTIALKTFELGTITGNIFDDIDYDGIFAANDINYKEAVFTIEQYYFDGNDWVLSNKNYQKTTTKGNLPRYHQYQK